MIIFVTAIIIEMRVAFAKQAAKYQIPHCTSGTNAGGRSQPHVALINS
jgi:hypothetical protein